MAARAYSSGAYEGTVYHRRLRPVDHAFRYKVFSLLIDLDDLPSLHQNLRLFSHNGWNILSFMDRDHGASDATPLKAWVLGQLEISASDLNKFTVELLCYPRMLGYVFNPLSVYFCRAKGGELIGILYEVNNTFGERHTYVIAADDGLGIAQPHRSRKAMYVSPFNDVTGEYVFKTFARKDAVSIHIKQNDADGHLFTAGFSGRRTEISDWRLLSLLVRYPLMTLKIIAAIHWEALRLMLKGLRLRPRPRAAVPPNHTQEA